MQIRKINMTLRDIDREDPRAVPLYVCLSEGEGYVPPGVFQTSPGAFLTLPSPYPGADDIQVSVVLQDAQVKLIYDFGGDEDPCTVVLRNLQKERS